MPRLSKTRSRASFLKMDLVLSVSVFLSFLFQLVISGNLDFTLTRLNQIRIADFYGTKITRSLLQCGGFCSRDTNCGSAAYNTLTKECQFSFHSGGSLEGNIISDVTWQTVTKTDCDIPAPSLGVDIPLGLTFEGRSLELQCQAGYQPHLANTTSTVILCQASGQWSTADTAFNCLIECGEPPGKANADISPGPTSGLNVEGDTRTYTCSAGYVKASDSDNGVVMCQTDGGWSASNLSCTLDCGTPSPMTGVDISTGDTFEGSSLTLQCQDGYQPETPFTTSTSIQCTVSGIWTTVDPSFNCLKECADPPSKTNAQVSSGPVSGLNVQGDTRTYTCDAGFGAASGSDNGRITCQANGRWSTSNLECVAGSTVAQWVSSVAAFSSQWHETDYYANQVIGAPDVFDDYGDEAGAWCSATDTQNGYIEVVFGEAVYITQLDVFETYHSGGVKKIWARDAGGTWFSLWSTETIQDLHYSRIFSPPLQDHGISTNYIRLDIDFSNWMEIDAIRMIGVEYL